MVTPRLNALEPTVLMPVAGDAPVVAPVNAQVCTVTPQLSVAVGLLGANVAVHTAGSVGLVTLAGQVMDGACVSLTVTVKEQVAVLPAASVAVDVTVVGTPTGKKVPLAGVDTIGTAIVPVAFNIRCILGKPNEASVTGFGAPQTVAEI